VEAVIRRSGNFEHTIRFSIKRSTYVDGEQEQVYRELDRLGYIKIDSETEVLKHQRAPGVEMVVSLTDKGAAIAGIESTADGWRFPIAREQILAITPNGQGPPPERDFRYTVEYGWELNDLGRRLEAVRPSAPKPSTMRSQTDIYIRRVPAGLIIVNP
jgi:hypothetical protein